MPPLFLLLPNLRLSNVLNHRKQPSKAQAWAMIVCTVRDSELAGQTLQTGHAQLGLLGSCPPTLAG